MDLLTRVTNRSMGLQYDMTPCGHHNPADTPHHKQRSGPGRAKHFAGKNFGTNQKPVSFPAKISPAGIPPPPPPLYVHGSVLVVVVTGGM